MSKSEQDTREKHIFRCSLGFDTNATTWITVESQDGSIDHCLESNVELLGMFENGERRVYCEGYWDGYNQLVWLGRIIRGLNW